jgi:hypothetical protein
MGLVGWVYSMTFKENKNPKGRQGETLTQILVGFLYLGKTLNVEKICKLWQLIN